MSDSVFVFDDNDTLKENLLYVNKAQNKYIIPASVITIEDGTEESFAFRIAQNTTFSLSFAENSKITTIGTYAFNKCTKLTEIDFTNAKKLTSIKNYSFQSCASLKSISFPKSLKEFCYYGAFSGCYHLSSVSFPSDSDLEVIYSGTFSNTNLTTFCIPSKVREVDGESFANAPIREFTVQEGNDNYAIYNGSIYTSDFSQLVCHQKATELNISDLTRVIGSLAFHGFTYNIILPNTVTTLNKWAFHGFNGESISILSPIKTITNRMFFCGSRTREIRFLNKVDIIDEEGIMGSNIEIIFFLYNPVNIAKSSFAIDLNKACFAWSTTAIKEAYYPTKPKICTYHVITPCSCKNQNIYLFHPSVFAYIFLM